MSRFELNGSQELLRHRARDTTASHIVESAGRLDRDATWPTDIMGHLRAAGLSAGAVPRHYGGQGFTAVDEVVLAEEISFGCSAVWTATVGVPNLGTLPLLLGGTPDQHARWFPRIADGELPAFSLTEPGGGSDVAAMTTVATRDGDHYVVRGTKRYTSNIRSSGFVTVFAKTDADAGHRGISAFVVDLRAPGITITRTFDKTHHRCYDTSEVRYDDVRIPVADRIGAEGAGFPLAMQVFDRNRPVIAGAAIGVARRALTEATTYASVREAFGRPIAEHQAIGHKLADMSMQIDAARLLALSAAEQLDEGRSITRLAAQAKAFATDVAFQAAADAVQVFGAAGIMADAVVSKLLRDAKVLQIYEGTNEIQRNIIVRELLREVVVPTPAPTSAPPTTIDLTDQLATIDGAVSAI